jgi:hypothetical protein
MFGNDMYTMVLSNLTGCQECEVHAGSVQAGHAYGGYEQSRGVNPTTQYLIMGDLALLVVSSLRFAGITTPSSPVFQIVSLCFTMDFSSHLFNFKVMSKSI